MLTSTPKAVKKSEDAVNRTIANRNKFILQQLETSAGMSQNSVVIQTKKLIKSFSEDDRRDILIAAKISPHEITAEEFVAMKADMGIPWEKLKTMAR